MGKSVLSYPVPISALPVEIAMPKGAQLLFVAFHDEDVRLFALVHTDALLVTRTVHVVVEGTPITHDNPKYVGSRELLFLSGMERKQQTFHLFDYGETFIKSVVT